MRLVPVLLLCLFFAFPFLFLLHKPGFSKENRLFLEHLKKTRVVATKSKVRGISLGFYSKDKNFDYSFLIREIGEHKANWISFIFPLYQENYRSSQLSSSKERHHNLKRLKHAIRSAHKQGLKVLLFPIVLLKKSKPGEWRGNMKPRNLDMWFRSYQREFFTYARFANSLGVEGLSVGSELSSLEKYGTRWKLFIKKLRQFYRGRLTYSANWDHYESVTFWDVLDSIGISGYYTLSESKQPTMQELVSSWRRIKKKILAWRKKVGLKQPILFTELGYPNMDGASKDPWNYARDAKSDPLEQRSCYESFIRVWRLEKAFHGVFFYNWFGFYSTMDRSYSPRGKPSAELIKIWFKSVETARFKRKK